MTIVTVVREAQNHVMGLPFGKASEKMYFYVGYDDTQVVWSALWRLS